MIAQSPQGILNTMIHHAYTTAKILDWVRIMICLSQHKISQLLSDLGLSMGSDETSFKMLTKTKAKVSIRY